LIFKVVNGRYLLFVALNAGLRHTNISWEQTQC